MKRYRFQCNAEDPRPMTWPIPHPYWITGYAADDSHATVVAYGNDDEYIMKNWPDAKNIESEDVDGYVYTSRFPKPEWMK